MVINSIETFVKSIPTATGSKWEYLEPFNNSADATIKSLLVGSALYNHIEALADDDDLKKTMCNLIAFQLYLSAIPFVDLVQTNNGFAVINSSNQAPASKERVERLILWCKQSIDLHTDLLILQIMSNAQALAEWTKFSGFKNLTNCFFVTGVDYSSYSQGTTRSDFLKAKSELLSAQQHELSEVISADYVAELIDQIRKNTLTETNQQIVDSCKLVLAKYAEKQEHEAKELLIDIVVQMEKNITKYPTYVASAEYALKNAPRYMNKSTDPTFFFGV